MILVDANVLIYARHSRFEQHDRSRVWLEDKLNGPTPVGLPWQSLTAFIRISTNARVFDNPLTTAQAWQQIEQWLSCETVWIPTPTDLHVRIFGDLLHQHAVTSRLVSDVHLAALAIEHGLTLCSSDGDFARFHMLKWINPIAA